MEILLISNRGSTHNEESFTPQGDSIIVVSPSNTEGFSVKEPGLYLLNIKKDTVAGSYQRVGTDNSTQKLTQEILRYRIDSLYQLMIGYNVSKEARNFNIPPFTIAKITDNTDAQIIGPYVKIPRSFDPNVEHEVYKFYTTKEIWDMIMKQRHLVR